MAITIRFGPDIKEVDIARMAELDITTYGETVFQYPGRALARFHKTHECFTAAYDGDRLVGVWAVHPVTEAFMSRAYASPVLLDDELEPSCFRPLTRVGVNQLFDIDLTVDSAYQNMGITNLMLEGFRELLLEKTREGYRFGKLFAYTISDGGRHVMACRGATFPHKIEGGELMELDLGTFLQR